eukprot:Skav223352  [mRNA]  locus=scaffold200:458325:458660:+ [translate_table: standard]
MWVPPQTSPEPLGIALAAEPAAEAFVLPAAEWLRPGCGALNPAAAGVDGGHVSPLVAQWLSALQGAHVPCGYENLTHLSRWDFCGAVLPAKIFKNTGSRAKIPAKIRDDLW